MPNVSVDNAPVQIGLQDQEEFKVGPGKSLSVDIIPRAKSSTQVDLRQPATDIRLAKADSPIPKLSTTLHGGDQIVSLNGESAIRGFVIST